VTTVYITKGAKKEEEEEEKGAKPYFLFFCGWN
jgi:hypothetical protein